MFRLLVTNFPVSPVIKEYAAEWWIPGTVMFIRKLFWIDGLSIHIELSSITSSFPLAVFLKILSDYITSN
jgi:hypothetical protein